MFCLVLDIQTNVTTSLLQLRVLSGNPSKDIFLVLHVPAKSFLLGRYHELKLQFFSVWGALFVCLDKSLGW